ncbi:macro domain-containing protein [Roseibium sp.]|uniref:type II toxin-antitoxin system antitoxin DNA ADP-ribosyl glycohydrolase DarG n=1 Tax=Roseibium sp. TaxID=1936156 RepID=UPI003A97C002
MMTIEYKNGDMFDEPTEAIVNTVNCVGVMGKGVALEFKRRWPENFKAYKKLCDAKKISPGSMFIFENHDILSNGKHRYLINFPTKQHWRAKSKIEYVREGLSDFVNQVRELGIKSVALPPLGCGNGGLDWLEVRPLIEKSLSELPDVKFVVFAPVAETMKPEQVSVPNDLTVERATMMVAFAELEKYFGGHLTRLTAQKLAYFLQVLGTEFGLKFSKQKFGPYSEALHHAFKAMELKHYIYGYSSEEKTVVVTPATYAAADEFLKSRDIDTAELISKLSLLIDGYETPYGMELLSSVHFLSVSEGIKTQPEMSEALEAWNDHKRDSFPRAAVTAAMDRLRADDLIN